MRKNKNLFCMLLVVLLVFSLLAGCGSPAEEDTAEEVSEETVTEPSDEVVITVAAGAVGQELELTQLAAEMYMDDNPGVTVNVLDTPDLAQDRLGLYLQFFEAQSSEVDVYQIDVIWPGDLEEHFVDLYEYGADAVVGDHFPAIVENNTVNGRLVAIPWFTDAGLLYYRTDLLEKYDFAPPETWEELAEQAQTIQQGERDEGNQDFVGYVWQGDAYEGLTCNALEWIASNNGGTIISPEGLITINNENAAEIIDMAATWVGTISPEGVTGMAEEDARAIWQGGNAAFMRNWPYAYSLGQEDDSAVKDIFDVSPLPAGTNGEPAATLGGWQLAVSKYSENPDIAADVALFMASYDMQKMRAVDGSLNPTIMDLYEDEDVLEAAPFFGSLYDVFINAVARPSTASAPNYNAVSTAFFRAVHNVLNGNMDAAAALEELELDLQDITGFDIE
ncbi:trehalose/maltose transport system substrate-binding protein [Tindallia magadiensis]|uniref:Trehalose/maltose transport system substrate-binding protein n=1 Tax=Tindallia magadiensis TaxID=69895 RepID=A0A1I3AP90_9FIRM|nr:ABC transporter substrate-binding protein [Tindallia magadiensis]SFH51877.1 trehalose/maltose transport system substrate-binding protein [Tindallia magadiensis]